ncbi:MAG TPA: hypothetical protein VKS21_04645, partial [Spirochaetota bacterium]|nr:hypothetical protein [Spirochaetota bacterium]
MKYTTIFVIMMALVIIICGLGIAFIWQNQNPMRSFVAGTNAYTVGNYEMAINKLSDYLSYGYNNDETEISRYYLAAAINRKREYLSETGGITQNESRLLDKRAKRTYLNVINGNKMNNKYVEAVIGYAEIAQRNGEYDRFITHKLEKVLHRHPESKLEDKIYTYLGY